MELCPYFCFNLFHAVDFFVSHSKIKVFVITLINNLFNVILYLVIVKFHIVKHIETKKPFLNQIIFITLRQ